MQANGPVSPRYIYCGRLRDIERIMSAWKKRNFWTALQWKLF